MKNLTTIKKIIFGLTILLSVTSCNITEYALNEKGEVTNKTTGEIVDVKEATPEQTESLSKGRLVPWP